MSWTPVFAHTPGWRSLATLVALTAAAAGASCAEPRPKAASGEEERATGVRLRDGDTIEVRTRSGASEAVRLLQVDTPESVRPGTPVQCGAKEAKAHLAGLIFRQPQDDDGDGLADGGKRPRPMWLETDRVSGERDRYGRLLAHVHVGAPEAVTLSEEQIGAGWGELYVFEGQHTRYYGRYSAAALRARAAGRGVNGLCNGDFHSEAQR